MGGRGASIGDTSKIYAIKYHDGTIYHVRNITEDNKQGAGVNRAIGHMSKEYGSNDWRFSSPQTVQQLAKDSKLKLYSPKAKAVNPEIYINRLQRWKNNELKQVIKDRRAVKVDHFKSTAIYKNRKRVVTKEQRLSSVRSALFTAKEDYKYIAGQVAWSKNIGAKVSKSDAIQLKKLERKIKALNKELLMDQ